MTTTARIAVIGAGMAGLACATRLAAAGRSVEIFDKGRGLGGRMATRRVDGVGQFDHGAQFFSARSKGFRALIDALSGEGAAAAWGANSAGESRYVGAPGMSAAAKAMGQGLAITTEATLSAMRRSSEGWRLTINGEETAFDRVVLTPPAPQSAILLRTAGETKLAESLDEVEIQPCLAVMAAFSRDVDPGFTARRAPQDDLSWIACDSAKPGRETTACWVGHASPGWSAAHLELERDEIAEALGAKLGAALGVAREAASYLAGHRWRYALASKPLGRAFASTSDRSLYAGGDWCLGARVEAAWLSGDAIARDLLSQ